jgi:hypothetical protein
MIILSYKGDLYKEITEGEIRDFIEKSGYVEKYKRFTTNSDFIINILYDMIKLNIWEYVYRKEFINKNGKYLIILRDNDYKMISREEKLSKLINN